MYRVKKVLNHNAVLAVDVRQKQEFLIMEKGIGYGKKISEYMEAGAKASIYSLKECTERGGAGEIIKAVSPVCLELADEVLNQAEDIFGTIDRSILFPMADHIEYAIKRIRNREQISNPLTEDIRVLFYKEYKAAQCIKPLLLERLQVEIDQHEIGYIALHIHSAINDEKVSQAMQIAKVVRECISLVEQQTGNKIDVMSLSYNRLMNHVRYMAARALHGENLKINMNDYMEVKFPEAFQTASIVCKEMENSLKCKLDETEIGYLAMHIERVVNDNDS